MKFIKKSKDWKLLNSSDINTFISSLKDWMYSIIIKKFGSRSLAQNSYLWLLYSIIEKETWIDKEEIHYYLKHKILWIWENWFPTTTELNKNEFTEYVEKIKDYASEFWIFLPEAIS